MSVPRLRSALGTVASWILCPFCGAVFERWAKSKSRGHLISYVVVLLIFFAVTAVMATSIARDLFVWSRLTYGGVGAIATINEASVQVIRKWRYATRIDYAFMSNDGIERKGAMKRDFRNQSRRYLEKGVELPIVYDPAWPALNAPQLVIDDIATHNNIFGVTFFGLGAVWTALGALLCGIELRRRRGGNVVGL